jgi:hypothetical protein
VQWAFLAVATIAMIELVLRLNVAGAIQRLLTVLKKVLRTLKSSRISDHWKERAMLAYSGRMFVASLTLLALFLLVLAPIAIFALLASRFGVPFVPLLTDVTGIVACIVIACIYLPLRRRLRHV